MSKYELGDEIRKFTWAEGGEKKSVDLRQIRALRDFADVKAGAQGGWVEGDDSLSQQGDCWIYDENSVVFGGARVSGNARLTQPCDIRDGAKISDNAWIDHAQISDHAHVSGNAMVQRSQVRGECHIFGEARVMNGSLVLAAKGLTPDREQQLHIYGHATVNASRVVHQAQIYGHALLSYAFVEHRAEIYENAMLEGNEENDVWVCDCAQVYGNARIVAGKGEEDVPTLRYSAQVYGHAVVEGNCVLKHHVEVFDHARLSGGPLMLDDGARIFGNAQIKGNVLIEDGVQVFDNAVVEAYNGDPLHLRGRRTLNGDQHITRTPMLGAL